MEFVQKNSSTSATVNADHETSNPFTSFYGQLLHQGNMLADYVRTGTYQKAMYNNSTDFQGKVVLDVGTGTGILAYFAIQAGAKLVYAVDASDSVKIAQKLADHNNYSDRIKIIQGKIEDITLPEKVDIIISEPIGFLLVHERMLETYVIARDKFLKPDGIMFPTEGSIVLQPFSDEAMYQEQITKAEFWKNNDFYGLDLSAVVDNAYDEYFSQAIVGYVAPNTLISANRIAQLVDFTVVSVEELTRFTIDFRYDINKTGSELLCQHLH